MTGPPPPAHPLDGILIADKGGGVTSFQVVAHLRRVLRVPKVGHGGTLDPMATGVLPILLGEATKLTAYLQAHDKEYEAIVRFGRETDTLDATGRVTAERSVPPFSVERLRTALTAFEGEIEQVPPMFSALHVGGRRLHELARAGVEVARAPRRVRIDRIELLDWTPPHLAIRVACSSGTYIRTLAADLGGALGCGGSLDALRRTRLGPFALTSAADWDLLRSGTAEQLAAHVEPPDHAVLHLPAVRLDEASAQRLRHGQRVLPERLEPVPTVVGRCRLYSAELFLGIGEVDADGIRALRLLHARNPRARSVSP